MTEKTDLLPWLDRGCTLYSIGSVLFPIAAPHVATLSEPFVIFVWAILLFLSAYHLGKRSSERKLDSKVEELERVIEAKDAQIADLARALALAESNASTMLSETGETLEHVKLCQKILDDLGILQNESRMKYISESIDGSPMAESARFSLAIDDLVKYGCLDGVVLHRYQKRERPQICFGEEVRVLRADYPALAERTMSDIEDAAVARMKEELEEERLYQERISEMRGKGRRWPKE